MSANKTSQARIQLKGIELLEVAVNIPKKKIEKEDIFNFNLNIEHKLDRSKELVFVIVSVGIFNNNDNTQQLGNIKTSCIYQVDNLDSFLNEAKQAILPSDLTQSLNSISLSTTRGIMFSQFKGTHLHQAIIPLFDMSKMKPGK
ncbi:MAG: hypothetical protein JXB49_19725 [Bacteroidales bacterium]|nr:hypothetical protein [Bacteroidales bacterium]